jgi:hypothetical protein
VKAKPDRQCACDVTLWHVFVTIFAMETGEKEKKNQFTLLGVAVSITRVFRGAVKLQNILCCS